MSDHTQTATPGGAFGERGHGNGTGVWQPLADLVERAQRGEPLADSIPSGAETTPQREKSASDDPSGNMACDHPCVGTRGKQVWCDVCGATWTRAGETHPPGRPTMGEPAINPDESAADIGTIANRKAYGKGATRSGDTDDFAFDLIPSCASRREAKRWRQGERGHGRGNWQQGQPIAVQVRHLLAHCNAYLAALERGEALAESERDDHLAAIRCNAAMLMWYEEAHPEMFEEGAWQAEVDE